MDAFGAALLDYHNGVRDRQITIRRDDGYIDTHDPALYFDETPQAHEADILRAFDGPVLDVGCGAGRSLLWMQERDVEAVGIDLSAHAVKICKSRGCAHVIEGDIMSVASTLEPETFGTAILFGNNIGIGGTFDGTRSLLSHLRGLIRSKGRLLITSIDVARTDEPAHLDYHARNVAAGRPRGEIRMQINYGNIAGPWQNWFFPQPGELALLANETRWRMEALRETGYGGYGAVLRRSD